MQIYEFILRDDEELIFSFQIWWIKIIKLWLISNFKVVKVIKNKVWNGIYNECIFKSADLVYYQNENYGGIIIKYGQKII